VSVIEVTKKILDLQYAMERDPDSLSILTYHSSLLESYGKLLGVSLAKYPTNGELMKEANIEIRENAKSIAVMQQNSPYENSLEVATLPLIGRSIQRIMELVGVVETLEKHPPQNIVSREDYDKVIKERDENKAVADAFQKAGFFPSLKNLLDEVTKIGLGIDEDWVISLCALNLVEAGVNKKLDDLGENPEGSFNDRLNKLCTIIREKERKEVPSLLIGAFYSVRSKLDHAGLKYKPSPKEAATIVTQVLEFLDILFTNRKNG
jgi:hypothetical protein